MPRRSAVVKGRADWSWVLSAACWLVLGLGPVVAILAALIVEPESWLHAGPLSARRSWLFVKSALLAFSVAGAASVIAAAAAHWLRSQGGARALLLWLPLSLLTVPPYLHAAAWMGLADHLGLQLSGWMAVFVIETLTFLPLGLAFGLAGFAMTDRQQVDAGRVFADDWRVFHAIELPQAAPAIGIGAALIFILAIADYSVPALMQVEVYALEAFVEYSIAAESAASLLVALPVLLLCVLLLVLVAAPMRALAVKVSFLAPAQRPRAPALHRGLRLMRSGAVMLCLAQVLVPVVSLFLMTPLGDIWVIWSVSLREIGSSLSTSMLAASVSVLLGLLLAPRLASTGWLVAVLLPLAAPGSLIGTGLIVLWTLPGLALVHGTVVMPVLADVARFAPLAILIQYVQSKRTDPGLIEAARLYRGNGPAVWLKVLLPLRAQGLAAGFFVVLGLSMSELTANLLVAPPGAQSLIVKIYGLLHYGASQQAAALCLFVLIFSMASMIGLLLALGRLRAANLWSAHGRD
ncbi:ABC transporter permease [Thiorhodococcus minor]|uniref:Iron ABC transporter permease n=1 Tax=Thiorhodococcus minor TaxID=57489 RepID=A0A6M0JYI4_9GAMM|nr:iron ABC transporter permease [Thiorhodococcus minor]NEV61165.1 iron ABC transporter permease [Thiorhodococcus minor]